MLAPAAPPLVWPAAALLAGIALTGQWTWPSLLAAGATLAKLDSHVLLRALSLAARLKPFSGFANPGVFDYAARMAEQDLYV